MTGAEHYRQAEEAIKASTYQRQEWGEDKGEDMMMGALWEIWRAQVHAMLALAAATALPLSDQCEMNDEDIEDWEQAFSYPAPPASRT